MSEPQLPKTAECLEKIEAVYKKMIEEPLKLLKDIKTYKVADEYYDTLPEEEQRLFDNPMYYLAEAICKETHSDETGGWAVDLAKYILTITHYKWVIK